MKRLQALEMSRKELIDALQNLTDSGKLVDFEENWEDAINSTISVEEVMSEGIIKENLAEYFNMDNIKYYLIKDDKMIVLVF